MLACARAAGAAVAGGRIPSESQPAREPAMDRHAWWAVGVAHLLVVAWVFGGVLSGRFVYFRDLTLQFAPDFAVLSRALTHGVWPLWNSAAHAGEPMLPTYPVDLLLVLLAGPRAPLGIGIALHLAIALVSASLLGRRLGMGAMGAWATGAVYGLGGFVLSTVNLLPLFEAAAWAPVVLVGILDAARQPTRRRVALLAIAAALQVTTLAAEVVAQTMVVGLLLLRGSWRRARPLAALVGAAALTSLLAAPALLGARALLEGSARGRGFPTSEALAFSLHPAVLVEALVPRWLGDPHALTDADNWAAAYFPEGHPYLLSLYVGFGVVLLALRSRGEGRWWGLTACGLLLSLGSYGPLGFLPEAVRLPVRGPQKFFLLVHLGLAVLAGLGLDRSLRAGRPRTAARWLLLVPGGVLLLLALALRLAPQEACRLGARLVPALGGARGLVVATTEWPHAWLGAGVLALGVALALLRGGRTAAVAGILVAVDLATVNGSLNPLVEGAFFELRPAIGGAVREAAAEGRYRFFSYGVAYTPGLALSPAMARARSDAWLFYLDRQALLPRTPALDGLESALGVDRTGWAPPGSALSVAETTPARFAECSQRLRMANVRWILSFRPLPTDLVARRAEIPLPEVPPPLGLYELRDPLPRAFWVARYEVESDEERALRRIEEPSFDPRHTALLASRPRTLRAEGDGSAAEVRYERLDAHTVRVRARTPPGFIVVLDGYHRDWRAIDESGRVPLLRADGRYWALPTPGGERSYLVRYRPAWVKPALLLSALGALVVTLLLWNPRCVQFHRRAGTVRARLSP
jgi:hypothetical protein